MIRRTIGTRTRRAAVLLLAPLLLVVPLPAAGGAGQAPRECEPGGATPEGRRAPAAAADNGLIHRTAYVSPQFGHAVGWAAPWVATDDGFSPISDPEQGLDTLNLVSGETEALLVGRRDHAGAAPAARLREELDLSLEQTAEFGSRLVGAPPLTGAAAAEFAWNFQGATYRALYEFHCAPSGALVWLTIHGPAADFPAAVAELRRTLTLDGAPFVVGDVLPASEFAAAFGPPPTLPSGVTFDRFVSRHYGFYLEWNPARWVVAEEGIAEAVERADYVALDGGPDPDLGRLEIAALTRHGGDPQTCLDQTVADLRATGFERLAPVAAPEAAPFAGGADGGAFAAFAGRRDGEEVAVYVECRTLIPGSAVLLVTHVGPPATFAAELEAAREVLATITPLEAAAGG